VTAAATVEQTFADLAAFAALEVASGDLEPWAPLMHALAQGGHLSDEEVLWLIKLNQVTGNFGSAWAALRRWPTPGYWAAAPDARAIVDAACDQEHRFMRGGRLWSHCCSYLRHLQGRTQRAWLTRDHDTFLTLMAHVRQVWGVGRQGAFEWVEFLTKAAGFALVAPHACLWESSGPRQSLQALFRDPAPTPARLDQYARQTQAYLAAAGMPLAWEDLETVLCDFHVMQGGRYYPGRHLAALRGDIAAVSGAADRDLLLGLFQMIIPAPWHTIAPGIQKPLLAVYRTTGHMPPPSAILAMPRSS
jgi:hypothetical protein